MNLPIFDKAKTEETDTAWIIAFWNGWHCVIPKNQLVFARGGQIPHFIVKTSKPLNVFLYDHDAGIRETKELHVVSMRFGQGGIVPGELSRSYNFSIDIRGIMCDESVIETVERMIS